MAAHGIWTGSVSFGLVTIPVKLYSAIREKRLLTSEERAIMQQHPLLGVEMLESRHLELVR